MPVRQAAKKNATKDGRRWSFYIYLTYTDGSKRKYQSQKYMTKKEAEVKWYDKSRQVKKDQSTFSMLKYNKGVDNKWI